MSSLKRVFLALLLSAALLNPAGAPLLTPIGAAHADESYPADTSAASQQTKATAALRMFRGSGDAATLSLFHPNYTEHDLSISDGPEGLKSYLHNTSGRAADLTILRVLQDGNYVVLQSTDSTSVSFDVFLFDGGLIAEHWQNTQPLAAPNASGRTMIDGTTAITGKGTTNLEANKHVLGEVNDMIESGDYQKLYDLYIPDFIQHSSYMGDGIAPLKKILEDESGAKSVTTNHLLLAEGNLVFSASESRAEDTSTAWFDFFRIENGKIAEHWDTMQEIPPRNAWNNNNGKF